MKSIQTKKSLSDVDVSNKRVFLRADFNVPISDGQILDDYKIKSTIPTIRYLVEKGVSRLVIGSHLGRPKGKQQKELSLQPVLDYINKYVETKFEIKSLKEDMGSTKFVMWENLRFYKEEDEGYGDIFTNGFDLIVVDAFGCVHRKARSMVDTGLPCVMGLLMMKEIEMASKLITGIDLCILGGAKVSDKLRLIVELKNKTRKIWIVGAMCFTVLKDGLKVDIGDSKYEKNAPVEEIMRGCAPSLPVDFVVKEGDAYKCVERIEGSQVGVDIGEKTLRLIEKDVRESKAIFWNGPPGVFEQKESSKGTQELVRVLMDFTKNGGMCVVGGGDTASAASRFGNYSGFTHVSTGGGSFLTLLEGGDLPGIDALADKN